MYNVWEATRLRGRLDVGVLERSLEQIAGRHEVLRTRYRAEAGVAVQVIDETGEVPLPVEDLSGLEAEEQETTLERLMAEEVERPFDLQQDRMLRAKLYRLRKEDHVLLLTLHHIASDGWSMGVLRRELSTFYGALLKGEASPPAELPVQYSDYAVWQRERLPGEVLEKELSYWRQRLKGTPPLLGLPT